MEVHKLIAEIDAATDRDAQLVEERIKNLKNVLEETDKRIAVHLRDLERSRPGKELYTNLGRISQKITEIKTNSEETEINTKSAKVLIAEMAAKGMPPDQIASKLKISLSEVDLALSLLAR